MSDNSNLTCKEFLEAIFEQIRPYAASPEEFANGWKRITDELDSKVEKLEGSMSERDELVKELLILMRTQLIKRTGQSTPFDDCDLQASQGCTILSDYADLYPRPSKFGGHQCDGINWDTDGKEGKNDGDKLPTNPSKPFHFHGGTKTGWLYCGSLDHTISNLICKVWGFSDFNDGEILKPSPSASFTCNDASMYLAALLCFGDNILNDQKFLETIGANLDKDDTPQKKLYKVLSVSEIRGKLRKRIQGHIKEDDSKSPDQP